MNNWQFSGSGSSDAAIVRSGSVTNELVAAYPFLDVLNGDPDPNNWQWSDLFNEDGNGYDFPFADVTDAAGVTGKGPNSNPASIFGAHMFCQLTYGTTTMWCDPSYGRVYWGGTQQQRELYFDDQCVAGYYVITSASVWEDQVGVNLNPETDQTITHEAISVPVMLVKPNTIGGDPQVVAEITAR